MTVCGEGLGHASRMVALAKYLQENGYDIVFASYGKAFDFIKSHGFNNVYVVKRELHLDGSKGYFSVTRSVWRSKGTPFNLLTNYYLIKRIIKKEGIDILISDSFFSSLFSAKSLKKKRYIIINQNIVHDEKRILKLFGKFVYRLFKKINSYADKVVIPDFFPPNHICEYHLKPTDNTVFIGPLIRYDPEKYDYSKEIIFCTFGGEPFKVPLYYKLKEIADQNKDLHFVVACGLEKVKNLSSDNFEVHSFIRDVDQYLCRAKATILHGGLTSIHETLCFGKSPLILYDEKHPEQKNNALKIESMNAGRIINPRKSDVNEISEKLFEVFKIDNSKFKNKFLKNQNGKKNMLRILEGEI